MDAAVAQPLEKVEKNSSPVEALEALVRDDLHEVNRLIVQRMESHVPLIPTLAGYLIQSGGKRLRPLLTLGCARMCGYTGSDHVKLAATVEFIHTATLLHDDVVDESSLRRGQSSANEVWGNKASVLVGDFLFSRAFNLMVEVGDLRILDVLSTASSIIAEGEVMQLANTANLDADEKIYLDIVSSKTAALFAAAAQVGALVAGRDGVEERALETFGRNLGVAFQLVDDALDFKGEQVALGKSLGDDFRECKCTLPIILAYAEGTPEERFFWKRTIEDGNQTDSDFAHAVMILERHKAVSRTIDRARTFIDEARVALSAFPKSPMRSTLNDILDFCVDRAY